NIVIRTLVRHGDQFHLRVGAGIVHDSVPEREYEETLDKARALIRAVDEALDDRTSLGVEAESGVEDDAVSVSDAADAPASGDETPDDPGGEPR
ncbi:MAG TPA: chorismate-binding protein, partial [Natronoarchaeum rubrum]|nr:chorismate-binding protein [Natronoarchaeum rubrum]